MTLHLHFSNDPAFALRALSALASNASSALVLLTAAQADLVTTFFDVRVVDSDASSYVQRDVNAVLSSIEHFKKQKYSHVYMLRLHLLL